MIGLSVAHYRRSPGASFYGFNEFNESRVWTLLVKQALESLGHPAVEVPTGDLYSKVSWINKNKINVVLEIHFNSSSNPSVQGCETLYCPGSKKGKRLAELVHSSFAPFMGNKNRGIKEGWYRMDSPGVKDYAEDVEGDEVIDYFLKKTGCPAIILEPEFIAQIGNICDRRFVACTKIAQGVINYLEALDG